MLASAAGNLQHVEPGGAATLAAADKQTHDAVLLAIVTARSVPPRISF